MSSQYLADVVMPPPTEEPCEVEETPEDIPTSGVGEPPHSNSDEVSYDSEEDELDPIPHSVPVRKQKIPQDEIFTPPKVKTILDPDSLKEDKVLDSIASKKPKQTRKKRGPATPEQLERLARGRAKAQET